MKRILLLCLAALLTLVNTELWAQERTVSGKVTSAEDGSPLPGVNVVLKGTTSGTVTDVDGNYRVSVPQDGGTLVFTFIGLESQEVEIGTRSVVDLVMSADTKQLSEVIVTAFGIERTKDEITYSAKTVNSEELMIAQQTRPAAGLVGKVAGLQVNIQSNGVNPSNQILLRGLRSVSQNNSALIVIDGIIATQGAFDDLNPNDIASINVLKGANAAALYGADASNGALVVTTKMGSARQQKFTVGLQSTYRFEEVAFMPDFQTTNGIGWAGAYDPIENTNWGPRFDGVPRRIGFVQPDGSFQEVPYGPIEDNLKDFYNTGKTAQNTVYLSGGSENASYYLSAGQQNTTGIIPNDEYQRTTFRINASQKLGKVKLSLNSSYFKDETNVVGNEIGAQDRPFYWFILNTPGNIPLTDYKDFRDPNSWGNPQKYYNAYYENPYWAIGTNRDIEYSDRLVATIAGSVDLTDRINWSTRLGVNRTAGTGKDWREALIYDPVYQPYGNNVQSFVEDSEYQRTDFNGQTLVTGNFEFADNFSLQAIVGGAFNQYDYRESWIRANNLNVPNFYDISNGTGSPVAQVDEEVERTAGLFADLTLGFRNFAFLNVTGRQDWTSTLNPGNNSYFYPGFGANVILSEAIDAIKNSDVLSYLKLTASNTTVYNDLSPFQINERFQVSVPGVPTPFPLPELTGFVQAIQAVDPNIKKEKLNATEVSVLASFLNNRVDVEAAYFNTITSDLITSTTPSSASGADFFLTNIGELQSSGIELSLSGNVITTRDFTWRLNVNYTSNETVINEIKPGLEEIAIQTYNGGTHGTYAIVGKAFPQIKATGYTRDPQGRVVVGQEGNPIVGDVIALGKTTPDYILGGSTTFSWKGLSLAATFDYRTGHVYYEQGSDEMEFTGRSMASVSANREDFVFPNSVIEEGEGNFVPNTNIPITGGAMLFWQNTYNEIKENYVKDATAFKIREVALNYTFPQSLLEKAKVVNKLTLGFVATNVLTLLPEENRFADPEFNNVTAGVGGSVGEIGYASNSIGIGGYLQGPPTRTYGINLNIEF